MPFMLLMSDMMMLLLAGLSLAAKIAYAKSHSLELPLQRPELRLQIGDQAEVSLETGA
jgi:hypothetical protein